MSRRGGVEDDPGGFAAQALIGDGAQRHDHITEVQPGGAYLNADLPRGQRGGRARWGAGSGWSGHLYRWWPTASRGHPVGSGSGCGPGGGCGQHRCAGPAAARRPVASTAMASRLSSVAAVLSVSSKMMRSGCSFWAVWISAQTAACARSGTPS